MDRADQALYEAKRSGRDRARAHGRLVVPMGAVLTANA
jgi:hypothetical protein